MASGPQLPTENPSAKLLDRILRFKWAAFSALVIFFAVYWIDRWFSYHGLRRDALLLDNFILALLVLVLGIAQQLRHEHELRRHREVIEMIGEMNHHTRNALQVIVNRSWELGQPLVDANAIEDIRQAVKRIEWCLLEVLPHADRSRSRKPPVAEPAATKTFARAHGKK